jgi:hypothetical protein
MEIQAKKESDNVQGRKGTFNFRNCLVNPEIDFIRDHYQPIILITISIYDLSYIVRHSRTMENGMLNDLFLILGYETG